MRVRKDRGATLQDVLLSLCLLIVSTACLGQITTSTIVGTVTDSSGASVPGATVTAINTETNYSRTAKTNDQGEYRLEFLPVGSYRVEVSASGFQKLVRNNVVVEIAQPARADAQLQLGQVSQTVEVGAEVPLVNTTTPEIGRTVDTKEIENLPIVNRNVYTLLTLTPGVQSSANSIVLGYPEQRTLINGGVDVGAGSVNYYLDGGSNMTGIRNTGNILPNPDALQEFRVQTNSYSAQYGRFQNGVVNVLTKSGTNQIHGSAFEFVRNTIFNANDWGNTLATPPYHRNNFGVTVGGPIVKDKTFFFASYGGLRQITSTFESSAVLPSVAELSGNFQNTSNGVVPNDPTTGKPFANNTIPAGRMDQAAVKILQQFIPTASNAPGNRFNATVPNPYDTNEFLGKIDHNFTDRQRLTLSYFETSGNNAIVPSGSNLPYGLQQFNWRQHNANVSDTWTISPTLINQVWLNYTRNFGGRLNTPATSLASFGSAFTPDGPVSLPDISVTGFFHLADAIDGPVTGTNFYALRDVVSWSHGRHSISFGAEQSLEKDVQQSLLNNYGVYQFSGSATTPTTPKGVKCPDCAIADFELGIPSKVQQDAPSFGYTNTWYTAFFLQDDFRVKPRLTLNLGLRWDIQTPPVDPANKESTYVPGVQSTVRPTAPAGILFPGDPGITRGIVPVRWNHVSPRLGLAFDPFGDGKTSIRAAAGLFWGSVSGNEWNTTSNFEPFAIRINPFPNVNKNGTGATLSNPYQGYPGGNPFPYAGAFVSGATIFGPSTNFQWPYTYQLNASIQRQVTNALSVQVAYVGSLSHDEPFATDLNYPLAGNAAVPASKASASNFALRRPNQSFGTIFQLNSNQTASYNGLQISAVQRLSHHLSFNAWYVYSKTFDSVQLDNNTAQGLVEDFSNPLLDRGPADFDIRHQAVVSMIYQPDYYSGDNRVLKNTINGWSISPIFGIHSGIPFTVGNGIDANFDGQTNDRAQLIGNANSGACPNGFAVHDIQCWINTSAFAQNNPAAGSPIDGNSSRNGFRAPGFKNVDLAIFRTFGLTERFHLQFRAESSNVLNIANYNIPSATVATSNFGTITGATGNGTGNMRQLQLGLRLTY